MAREVKNKSLRELLSHSTFAIDYYQREYRWGEDEVRKLIEDIAGRFLLNYEDGHARGDVAGYEDYFVSDIILSRKADSNDLHIVDGQQRLTTATLILIYLKHRLEDINASGVHDEQIGKINSLIISEHYGDKTFNLNIPERTKALQNIYDKNSSFYEGSNLSVKQIYTNYQLIKDIFPEAITDEILPFFIDYFLEKVEVVEIICTEDKEAYRIFEGMNDRGKPINPIDSIKGYMISNILEEKKKAADDAWRHEVNKLRNKNPEYELDFFASWFGACYAVTSNTVKGAVKRDFQDVRHKSKNERSKMPSWVRDNAAKMGTLTPADFYNTVVTEMPFYASVYLKIIEAEEKPLPGLEIIYYVAKLHHFKQARQMALSVLKAQDTEEEIKLKLRIIYTYLDVYLARKLAAGESIQLPRTWYVNDPLTVELRKHTDPKDLALFLKQRIADMRVNTKGFEELPTFVLKSNNKLFAKWLLARFTNFLEKQSGGANSFEELMKKPYEIEHLIASNQFNDYDKEFPSIEEFERVRNQLGALLLIRGNVNQSLQDKPYLDKISAYRKENLWAQSLHSSAYKDHPRFNKLIKDYNLPFEAHEKALTREYIDKRNLLLIDLAKLIWSEERLDFALPIEKHGPFQGRVQKQRKSKKSANTEEYVSPLLKGGILQPGDQLRRTIKGKTLTAKVRADGQLEGSNGKVGSPSGVAKSLLPERSTVSGWKFWKTESGQSLDQLRRSLREKEEKN